MRIASYLQGQHVASWLNQVVRMPASRIDIYPRSNARTKIKLDSDTSLPRVARDDRPMLLPKFSGVETLRRRWHYR
jgi:hypothetical protein